MCPITASQNRMTLFFNPRSVQPVLHFKKQLQSAAPFFFIYLLMTYFLNNGLSWVKPKTCSWINIIIDAQEKT